MAGTTVHPGRFSADVDGDVVVLLIGARANSFRRPRSLWLVGSAMPRMLRRLGEEPGLGLLHAETFRRGRTTLMVQYWESHQKLQRFATDPSLPHAPAWKAFMREIGDRSDVGIWHETYIVPAGHAESIYTNMPLFGLAAATRHAPTAEVGHNAAARLAHGRRPSRIATR